MHLYLSLSTQATAEQEIFTLDKRLIGWLWGNWGHLWGCLKRHERRSCVKAGLFPRSLDRFATRFEYRLSSYIGQSRPRTVSTSYHSFIWFRIGQTDSDYGRRSVLKAFDHTLPSRRGRGKCLGFIFGSQGQRYWNASRQTLHTRSKIRSHSGALV